MGKWRPQVRIPKGTIEANAGVRESVTPWPRESDIEPNHQIWHTNEASFRKDRTTEMQHPGEVIHASRPNRCQALSIFQKPLA